MCQVELSGAPKCVIAACLKTALNGWATARRRGDASSRCVFGCRAGSDCLEHYLRCNQIERIWLRLFGDDWGAVEERLAIGCGDAQGRLRRAFFLYCLYGLYNVVRHARRTTRKRMFGIARGKLIFAMGKSSSRIRRMLQISADIPSTQPRLQVSGGGQPLPQDTVGPTMFKLGKRRLVAPRARGAKRRII